MLAVLNLDEKSWLSFGYWIIWKMRFDGVKKGRLRQLAPVGTFGDQEVEFDA